MDEHFRLSYKNHPQEGETFKDTMGFFRALYAAARVTVGAGANIIQGVASTAADACEVVNCLAHKDVEGSLEIVGRRIERSVYGVGYALDNAMELLEDLGEDDRGPFLREENIQRMTTVATAGLVAAGGIHLLSDDPGVDFDADGLPDGDDGAVLTDMQIASSFDLSPDAVENGVFVGDASDLDDLTRAGELSDTTHIDSSDIDRSMAMRDGFLSAHGFDSVPEGYEVHHIVPLSEGGSDTPDNMILVREDLHDQITAAHRAFYGWNA